MLSGEMSCWRNAIFINGEWVKSQGGTDHLVIDPSTEEPTAVITLGSEADTNAAVAAAKAALPAWMATPVEERIAYVSKLIEVYESRAEDLAVAMSAEMGALFRCLVPAKLAQGLTTSRTLSARPRVLNSAARWDPTRPTIGSSMNPSVWLR